MAKIVIIDDEPAILQLMTKLCEGLNHQVTGLQSGAEGLRAIEEEKPEVLIVDLRIGDMSGIEIIQKCSKEFPKMPIIFEKYFQEEI